VTQVHLPTNFICTSSGMLPQGSKLNLSMPMQAEPLHIECTLYCTKYQVHRCCKAWHGSQSERPQRTASAFYSCVRQAHGNPDAPTNNCQPCSLVAWTATWPPSSLTWAETREQPLLQQALQALKISALQHRDLHRQDIAKNAKN